LTVEFEEQRCRQRVRRIGDTLCGLTGVCRSPRNRGYESAAVWADHYTVQCHAMKLISISLKLERDSRVQGLQPETALVVTLSCEMEIEIEGDKPRSLSIQ
jgi:hypothetical protein